jgi:integrase
MPRKTSGTLVWTKTKGWVARIPIVIDGERVKKTYELGTTDRAVARRKLARVIDELATGAAVTTDAAKPTETLEQYAKTWFASRAARGIAATSYEKRYFERVWKPAAGALPLEQVSAALIRSVLEDVVTGKIRPKARPVKKGQPPREPGRYSPQSVSHIRSTLFRILQSAYREELVSENRAARVEVPEFDGEREGLARAVPTDAEIAALVAHPDVDVEIKMLVLVTRLVGGLRAGDLNALDWTAFSPEFATCTFVRRKTRKKKPTPQTFEVPSSLRSLLRAWWDAHGRPEAGPVFPVRKGKRAGEAKKKSNMSYADRLRRALWTAGVRRHELHNATSTTLPTDFHSVRRAYATALARANVNEQTAMDLTGHSDSKVHKRYVEAQSIRVLPEAATPRIPVDRTLLASVRLALQKKSPENRGILERDTGLEPVTPSLGSSCSTN